MAQLVEVLQRGPMAVGSALQLALALTQQLQGRWQQTGSADGELALSRIRIESDGLILDSPPAYDPILSLPPMAMGFLSPEALNHHIAEAGDIYAVGCVLYMALSGGAVGQTSTNHERHQGRLAHIRDTLVGLGHEPSIIQLVNELLAFDPSARPSGTALCDRLKALAVSYPPQSWEDLLAGRPPPQPTPRPPAPAQASRANIGMLLGIGVLALGLALMLIGLALGTLLFFG